jgi:hypothetical protein
MNLKGRKERKEKKRKKKKVKKKYVGYGMVWYGKKRKDRKR